MLTISSETTKLLLAIPTDTSSEKWHAAVHVFYAAMGAESPEWQDGVKVVPNDGTMDCSVLQWCENVEHLANQGVKLQCPNTASYWYMQRSTSKWVGLGKLTLIEVLHVENSGGDLYGNATEYFPTGACMEAFSALLQRVSQNLTTKDTGTGYSLEAIALDNADNQRRVWRG